MKKKIILSLLIIFALFTITGCGNSNNSEETIDQTLKSIHYKENYVDFHSDAIGNIRTMSYIKQEKVIFEVRVMYDENRSLSELKATLETQTGAKEQSKEINGIKYIYYEYKNDDNLNVHHYMYVYDGKVYSIGFFLGENYGNIEEIFMNNVSFE